MAHGPLRTKSPQKQKPTLKSIEAVTALDTQFKEARPCSQLNLAWTYETAWRLQIANLKKNNDCHDNLKSMQPRRGSESKSFEYQ